MKASDVWFPPFRTDLYGWIYDKNNEPVFSFEIPTSEEEDLEFVGMARNIVNILNGKEGEKYAGLSIKDGCDLYQENRLIGSFRGWGHLTGRLNLSCEEAARVQDEFIEFCLEKIKKED